MTQPTGYKDPTKPHHVCRLHKALYGLRQAPRAWFERLKGVLLSLGFKNSISDPSLFYFRNCDVELYLLVYVDDIILTGSHAGKVHAVIDQLQKVFSLKTLGSMHYFLGFEIKRSSDGIHLSQMKYTTDLLKRTNMVQCSSSPTPIVQGVKLSLNDSLPFDQPSFYRSVIGGLQYLTLSRPDIAFTVNKLSQFMQVLLRDIGMHAKDCCVI